MDEAPREPGLGRRGWRPHSLRGRVLGAMLLVGLLPVIALGGYGFFTERRRAVSNELIRLSEESQRLAVTIDRRLTANLNLARHLAFTTDVVAFLGKEGPGSNETAAMNTWLRGHAGLVQDVYAIFLLRTDGICVASSEASFLGVNYSFRGYFKDALKGRYRPTDWQIGLKIQKPCVFVAEAVRKDGRILGMVVTRLDVSWVQSEIEAHGQGGRMAFLINPDGIILAHSRPQLVYSAIQTISPKRRQEILSTQQFLGREHPVPPSFRERSAQVVLQVLETGQPRHGRYVSTDGVTRWAVLRKLVEEPWVVGVASAEQMILAHSRNLLLWSAFVGLLMVGLVVAGGIWFSRRILNPLGRLESLIRRFASGDASVRAPETGGDEVGRLGRYFNEMAGTIQEQTDALAKRVDTLEGILPICASCHKIRNEEGVYEPVEAYISTHSSATFTHGICDDCARKLYPELFGPDGKRRSSRKGSGGQG